MTPPPRPCASGFAPATANSTPNAPCSKPSATSLDTATTEVNDPTLLDKLPILGDILTGAPAGLAEQLFEAFHVHAVYSKELPPGHHPHHHHRGPPRRPSPSSSPTPASPTPPRHHPPPQAPARPFPIRRTPRGDVRWRHSRRSLPPTGGEDIASVPTGAGEDIASVPTEAGRTSRTGKERDTGTFVYYGAHDRHDSVALRCLMPTGCSRGVSENDPVADDRENAPLRADRNYLHRSDVSYRRKPPSG